MLISELLTIES